MQQQANKREEALVVQEVVLIEKEKIMQQQIHKREQDLIVQEAALIEKIKKLALEAQIQLRADSPQHRDEVVNKDTSRAPSHDQTAEESAASFSMVAPSTGQLRSSNLPTTKKDASTATQVMQRSSHATDNPKLAETTPTVSSGAPLIDPIALQHGRLCPIASNKRARYQDLKPQLITLLTDCNFTASTNNKAIHAGRLAQIMAFRLKDGNVDSLDQQVISVMNVLKAEVTLMTGDPENWLNYAIVKEVYESVRKLSEYLRAHRKLPAMEAELCELKIRDLGLLGSWDEDLRAAYDKMRSYTKMLYNLLCLVPAAIGKELGLVEYFSEESKRSATLVKDAGSRFGVLINELGELEQKTL